MRLLLQGLNDTQKLLVQLVACCRWFDSKVIRYLTEQHNLDFATAADDKQNCFGWLTQLSFVEPAGKHWRLDDVARDIFRQSLEREDLERIHTQLAEYFLALSDQEANPNGSTSEKYDNPEWLSLRSDYLYHLLFTRPSELQTVFIAHLLEARCLRQDGLVHTPLRAIVAEFDLSEHPLLRNNTRQFLQRLRPAVEHGWAVLEEDPIDYSYNETNLGLSKIKIDQAVATCLHNPSQFEGLSKFAALFYKAQRCAEGKKLIWLQQTLTQAEQLLTVESLDFLAELFLDKLGSSFYKANFLEKAIACNDAALTIKPDCHEALNNKGTALMGLGQYEAAIACYDAALKIKPNYHIALMGKGAVLSRLVQYEAAIASCDAALAIKPDYYEALNNKGAALSYSGQYEAAITCFNTALALQSDDPNSLYNKACCYALQSDADNALPALQAAIALAPKNRDLAKTDTDFDLIRTDERFQALLAGD